MLVCKVFEVYLIFDECNSCWVISVERQTLSGMLMRAWGAFFRDFKCIRSYDLCAYIPSIVLQITMHIVISL